MKFTLKQIREINNRVAELTTRDSCSAVPAYLTVEQIQAVQEQVTKWHWHRIRLTSNETLKEYSGGRYRWITKSTQEIQDE